MNNILQKIKDGTKFQLEQSKNIDFSSEIYKTDSSPLKDIFQTELEKVSGKFINCSNNVNFPDTFSRSV